VNNDLQKMELMAALYRHGPMCSVGYEMNRDQGQGQHVANVIEQQVSARYSKKPPWSRIRLVTGLELA